MKLTSKIIIILIVAALLAGSLICLTSCASKKPKEERFKVICPEGLFENVKESYKAGQQVKIYFPFVATDTDYTFYLDGERMNDYEYDDRKGFVFSFTMPAKDVTLDYESKNSMENPFQTFDETTSLVTYTKRISTAIGDSVYEVTLESTEAEHEHMMTVYHDNGTKNVYIIPVFPYESLRNYALSADLKSWNDLEDYDAIDGTVITVSIFVNGEYVTVSTNKMPKDSESVFNYMHSFLTEYMTDEYKVE